MAGRVAVVGRPGSSDKTMKRKPRQRPKPRADRQTAAAPRRPQPRGQTEAHGASAAPRRTAWAASPRTWRLSVLTALLIMAGFVGGYVVLRLRAGAAAWPSRQDVGLPIFFGIIGAALLMLSSLTLILAQRLIRSGKPWPVRVCLSGTIVLGAAAIAFRGFDYHVLTLQGMVPWRVRESTFDHADLYYVQAVRAKLKQHFLQLEGKRTDRPDLFTSEDQERLDLVQLLQTSMVSWTEQEIGHWLDDLEQRRSVMAIMAYQIHPLERDREAVKASVAVERKATSRSREWFSVMQEYCRRKTALIEALPPPERPSSLGQADAGSESGTTKEPVPGMSSTDGEVVPPAADDPPQPNGSPGPALQEACERLNQSLRNQLAELGAQEWAYAKAVIADTVDLAMTGERSTQIETRLANIDARVNFLAYQVDPVLEGPEERGLNAQHRWLQLPVSFPHARAWFGGYVRLTSIHVLLLTIAMLTLVLLTLTRMNRTRAGTLARVGLMWHAIVVAGVTLFVLFSGA